MTELVRQQRLRRRLTNPYHANIKSRVQLHSAFYTFSWLFRKNVLDDILGKLLTTENMEMKVLYGLSTILAYISDNSVSVSETKL